MCKTIVKKFDDLGDSLLHALNKILCGSLNYRPLVPYNPSVHINRTVVLTILPDKIYWVVLHCTWNLFILENLGVSHLNLHKNQRFAARETIDLIKQHLDSLFRQALVVMTACDVYTGVECIKIVVKQLRGYIQRNFLNKAAGALTASTVAAV